MKKIWWFVIGTGILIVSWGIISLIRAATRSVMILYGAPAYRTKQ